MQTRSLLAALRPAQLPGQSSLRSSCLLPRQSGACWAVHSSALGWRKASSSGYWARNSSTAALQPEASLRWTPTAARAAKAVSCFADHYFDEDNVLNLYSIQRVQLSPKVQEQAKLREGLQHVDITWELGGKLYHGSGSAKSKKTARREAARRLLRGLPLGRDAKSQMRKQMLHGLQKKLAAEVLEDGPAGVEAAMAEPNHQAHRVVWRVPQPSGRPPVELSASGSGCSASAAQADAWERLYLQAAGKQRSLQAGAAEAAKQQREEALRQQLLDAAAGRQDQLACALSVLSSEAAGELAARHNAVVQRLRIAARDQIVAHQSGYYCTLHWKWQEPSGQQRTATSTSLGASKRQAKGEAIRVMLTEQGMGDEGLDPYALNEAAKIRSLAKAGEDAAAVVAATCNFLEAWPPSCWSLSLPEVWHFLLAQGDSLAVEQLGSSLRQRLQGLGGTNEGAVGLAPHLWESLLDACAHVACGSTAEHALKALCAVPLDEASFPTRAHKDYFRHYRWLIATERVGANQASSAEINELGSSAQGLLMQQQGCILPYLTLAPEQDAEPMVLAMLADLRVGDVVYLRPRPSHRAGAARPPVEMARGNHLAVLTSVSRDSSNQKLTLRCNTLTVDDMDELYFEVHGLDSEVTTLRTVAAIRAAAQPHMPPEERPAQDLRGFHSDLTALLVGSFRPEGLEAAQISARASPPGCNWSELPGRSLEDRVMLVASAATSRGSPLTNAQAAAVRAALQNRLTLIHGPPGTGKTTAAACVVLAWRALGDKILCVADSNVAADNLHKSLANWGVKAYRFAPGEMGSDAPGTSQRGAERLSAGSVAGSEERRRGRSRSPVAGSNSVYHRLLAARDAIASFQVIVTTCSSAGHELLRSQTFPRVLVDECTQSVEPSTLVPLSHGCSHLVLIGDHKQLPPTVISDEARKMGLDKSLFARLVEEAEGQQGLGTVAAPVLLDEQRRMHPSISAFPNTHFYRGRVRDAAPSRAPVHGVPWPAGDSLRVLLVDVQASDGEEQQGTSWRNAAEVDAVLDLAAHVLRSDTAPTALPGPQLSPEEIAVLTPYFQQKQLLQTEFSRRARRTHASEVAAQLGHVRVSTVDGFQGAESDLVIFSAVRSNVEGRLGFLSDVRRANVVLTRARRGLVVFADAATMRQARGSVWAQWLAWMEDHRAVMSLAELRSRLDERAARR